MPKQSIKIALVVSSAAFVLSALLQMQHSFAGYMYPLEELSATIADTALVKYVTYTNSTEERVQGVLLEQESVATEMETGNLQGSEIITTEEKPFAYEQSCPFLPHDDSIVIPLEGDEMKRGVFIPEGHYTVQLASKRTSIPFPEDTSNGWFITFTSQEGSTALESGVARMIYDDEKMVVELVEGLLAVKEDEYMVHVVYEDKLDSVKITPLCAILEHETLPEELFPVTQNRLLPDVDSEDFMEDIDSKFDSYESEFDKKFEEKTNEYEETVTEKFDSDLFKQSTGTTVYATSGTKSVTTNEAYYTGENNEIYVEVTTHSTGFAGSDEGGVVLNDVAEKREILLDTFKEDTFFELLQSKQEYMRETKLPELIAQRADIFGEVASTIDLRRKTIEHQLSIQDSTTDTREALEAFRYAKKAELETGVDSDGDGVTDYDEVYIYQSDPHNPFTAGSVLTDGERILLGLDPNRADYRVLPTQSPKDLIGSISDSFKIHTIDYTEDVDGQKTVLVEGSAQPHSFVTVYVYSTPIIVTVRTDENGKFSYTLERQLENGTHELYVASVNNTGKILAQSSPHPFIKTAESITYTPASVSNIEDPVDSALQKLVAVSLLLTLLCAIGITMTIGYMKSKRHESEGTREVRHEEETD